ncbi:uncharacterized protein DEA37_0008057 [Paragonimus westermani]|uniref:Uncharacterized protein n=1 Tax=Paragonimus westermani TaxID=34504 RepID=A0A5J4N635_9TREM|nr:uncharacterized protein DEA37_0008057 [Paragonimus westermani]
MCFGYSLAMEEHKDPWNDICPVLSTAYYPEWWNVHTHRCNHHCRIPTHQDNFGRGRALFADWGRVGAVKVCLKDKDVQILPQLSDSLKNKLFYCAVPSPLLAAGYRQRSCSSDSCEDKFAGSAVGANFSASLCDLASVYDFGYTGHLYDPVLFDQAAANFLCGKLLGLLRPNAGILHERSANAATVLECLEQLEKLAVMGQDCTTEGDQLAVLSCIQSHLRPEHAESVICSDEDATANNVIDQLPLIENHGEDSEIARQNDSTERLLGKRRRKTSKSPSKHRLPLTFEKFLDYDTSTNEHRLLAALDPFVIRLASRSVHPDYRGHGLLCTSDDLLLWSTPHPICSHSVPRLWHNVPDRCTSENQINPIFVDVPGVFLPQTRLCELDVASVKSTSNYAVVTRWISPSQGSCTNVQFMQLHISDDSRLSCISHAFRPELPSQSTSVCLNPWLPGEFAAAGHCSRSPGDTLGYVQVYSATGDRNEIPAWSCHINLEDCIDGQLGDHVGTMNAAGFTGITDPVQSSLMTYISSFSTNSWKHIAQSPIGSVATNFGLRIGYASHPGELCCSTTRRMLLMDTRQTKVAQELFTLSPNPTGPLSRFSMTECLTCVPSKFFGDVYALGATPFSLFMLDKRMPGRTVLHWSHSLLGSPVYLHWCSVDQLIRDVYDLPQFFLSVAAQFPADIGLVGLNVSPPGQASGGPQLVGPSISGSRLTELTYNTHLKLPARLLNKESTRSRLQASFCGMVSRVHSHQNTKDADVEVIGLTSHGDLFKHTWAFGEPRAIELSQQNRKCNGDWLSGLICSPTKTPPVEKEADRVADYNIDLTQLSRLEPHKFELSGHSTPEPGEETNVMPASKDASLTKNNCWDFTNLPPASDFSGRVVKSSTHLVSDLKSIWGSKKLLKDTALPRTDPQPVRPVPFSSQRCAEEKRRRTELDSLTVAAKQRLRRLKAVIDYVIQSNH